MTRTSDPDTTECPRAKILTACAKKRLAAPARHKVIEHMATCESCRAFVLVAGGYEVRPKNFLLGAMFSGSWQYAGVIAAVAITGFLAPGKCFSGARGNTVSLVAASEKLQYRSLEGRLSGGFAYRRMQPAQRGANAAPDWRMRAPVIVAAIEIRGRAREQPTVDALHELGKAQVLTGDYDEAIDTMVRALFIGTRSRRLLTASAQSQNALLLGDLSAALLARAGTNDSSFDRQNALEIISRAWELRRTPEIAWNRALATEAANAPRRAVAAWNDYLLVDSESVWRGEAEPHIRRLQKQPEKVRPPSASVEEELRDVEESILPGWSNAALAEDWDAANISLAALQKSARRLRLDGEYAVASWIDTIASASASNDSYEIKRLAVVSSRYHVARNAMADRRYEDARRQLTSLWREVSFTDRVALKHPEMLRARIGLALSTCEYYAGQVERSLDLAQQVAAERVSSASVRGNALWLIGLSESVLGRIGWAAAAYEQAISEFDANRFPVARAAVEGLYAGILDRAGEQAEAWKHRTQALQMAAFNGERGAKRFAIIANDAARAAIRSERYWLARTLLDEILGDSADPIQTIEALLAHATVCSNQRRSADAMDEISRARSLSQRIPDAALRRRLDALGDAAEAAASAAHDADRAVDIYSRAIKSNADQRRIFRLADLLVAKARAEIRSGRDQDAELTLQAALRSIDEESLDLRERNFGRASPIDGDDVYELLIELAMKQGDTEKALELAVGAQLRRSGANNHISRTTSLVDDLRQALKITEGLLVFGETSENGIVWLITRQGILSQSLPLIDADTIEQLQRASSGHGRDALRALEEMHDAWFASIRVHLGTKDTLLIAPSARMRGRPFASWRDRRTGRYLVEDFIVVIVPNVTSLMHRNDRARHDSGKTVLFVDASPANDSSSHLPGVQREIEGIRQYSRTPIVLRRPEKSELLHQFGRYDLIHISGHGFADRTHPLLSYIELPRDRERQALYAGDIARQDLTSVRLVVLSACSTAAPAQAVRPQLSSMAEAFSTAGVRQVIGTLWPVADDDAAAFFTEFYKTLERTGDPLYALTETQRRLIRDFHQNTTVSWASFQLVGLPT